MRNDRRVQILHKTLHLLSKMHEKRCRHFCSSIFLLFAALYSGLEYFEMHMDKIKMFYHTRLNKILVEYNETNVLVDNKKNCFAFKTERMHVWI